MGCVRSGHACNNRRPAHRLGAKFRASHCRYANPMGALPLDLFPTSGFDRSATTPVWLGVLVSWFFTETFGWVFGGLVVPGYLAGIFVLDPRAGAIDVVEAVLTYVLAKTIDEVLPRAGLTFRSFGRERFFLVIVSSI